MLKSCENPSIRKIINIVRIEIIRSILNNKIELEDLAKQCNIDIKIVKDMLENSYNNYSQYLDILEQIDTMIGGNVNA